MASIATDQRLNLVGTILAVLLSACVAWLLARRIIGPVAVASAVATNIAAGKMDGLIPPGGADELGALRGAMGVMRDKIKTMIAREVAERRSAQTRLADAREGVVVLDAVGRIALANRQAATYLGDSAAVRQSRRSSGASSLTGKASAAARQSRVAPCFNKCVPPDRVQPGVSLQEVLELESRPAPHEGKSVSELVAEQVAFVNQSGGGAYHRELGHGRVVSVVYQPMADGGWVGTYEDITQRPHSEAQAAFLARHDALTGLPNRVLFGEKVEEPGASNPRKRGFSMLCPDLGHRLINRNHICMAASLTSAR